MCKVENFSKEKIQVIDERLKKEKTQAVMLTLKKVCIVLNELNTKYTKEIQHKAHKAQTFLCSL